MVTLKSDVDIPETEHGKEATLTIGDIVYEGTVQAIIVHSATAVATSKVTLEAPGLRVNPEE
jgi:hypothetical protein